MGDRLVGVRSLSEDGSVAEVGLPRTWIALWVGVAGCAYVTRDEYLDEWDEDDDGWPIGEDCAPTDSGVHPYAPDLRGDGCDNDCGTEPDADGDDWPDAADCGPADASIYPCSPAEDTTDETDHDCDGLTTARTDTCPGLDPDYPDVVPPCGDEP